MSSRGGRSDEEDVLELIGVNENQESNHGSGDEFQGNQDQLGGFQAQNSGDEATGNAGQKVTPKVPKRARSSVPRLTTELLKGPKGVHTIEKYFEGFKFHGKGREKEDLDRIMKRLEHWAHRLFPKLNFDDCLAKIELLGNKKDLQVFLKKYRTDMITADEDLRRPEFVDDDDDEEKRDAGDAAPQEEFDLLLAEQIEKQRQTETTVETNAFDNLLALVNSSSTRKEPASDLSDEVKERIERNRKLALERKMATMKRLQESKAAMIDDNNQKASTSGINKGESLAKNSTQHISDIGESAADKESNFTQKSLGDGEPALDKENNAERMEEDNESVTSDNADKNQKLSQIDNHNPMSQNGDKDGETKEQMEEAERNFLQKASDELMTSNEIEKPNSERMEEDAVPTLMTG